ncbi:MAG: lamin tail domain-containing protein, partial [Flavobacteriales bacterium]
GYSMDDNPATFITILDDGIGPDEFSSDGTFTFYSNASGNQISFRARARYGNDWTDWTCERTKWLSKQNSGLVINELMAQNSSTIADDFGEFNDWTELFNNSDQAISLSNKYLSNNQDELNKWALPDVTLEAGEFILIWLDNDPEQGYNHSNFNLNASGDDLYLSTIHQGEWRLIDCISFENLLEDQVLARNGDGSEEWVNDIPPTPGMSNSSVGIGSIESVSNLSIWPVPANDFVHFSKTINGQVLSIEGKVLMSFENKGHLSVEHLPSGIFLLKTSFGTFRLVKT